MKYQAFNIRYDTDGDDEIAEGLPKVLTVELDDDQDPSVDIADAISDKTGFCIFGCEFRPLCKYCGTVMFEENTVYCCDECGATLSFDCQEWTEPTVPQIPHKRRVVIFMEDGLISDVVSDSPDVDLTVIDYDVDSYDEDRVRKDVNGKACCIKNMSVNVDPKDVQKFLGE